MIVGGTGLYLKALSSGFFTTPEACASYREELSPLSSEDLHARLLRVDPESAAEIPVGNRVRMIRALEIYTTTGKSKSELKRTGIYPVEGPKFVIFWLTLDRKKLYQFINLRVDKMIRNGLIGEVETLCSMGYRDSPVLRSTVGYRKVLDYLAGKLSLDQCTQLIGQRTRNYAKRQITWFKKTDNPILVDTEKPGWKEFLFQEIRKLKLDSQML